MIRSSDAAWHVLGDWGTSRLRLYRCVGDQVIDRVDAAGIGVPGVDPAETLSTAIAPWLANGSPTHITLCGAVGRRGGLREVRYADCPGGARDWAAAAHHDRFDGVPLVIAAGMACTNFIGAPDVMRGEEAQIFGMLAIDPAMAQGDVLMILPGTHSKWARVCQGRIDRFHSFPVGELFALLRQQSSMGTMPEEGDDQADGFAAGIDRARQGLIGTMFEARSGRLRAGRSSAWASGFLSGLLIASEVIEARRMIGDIDQVVVIGDPQLTQLYRGVLAAEPCSVTIADGDATVLAGLSVLAALIEETCR